MTNTLFNKKILCIGNNTEDTNTKTTDLAVKNQIVNHGLISTVDFVPVQPGYYHTTVVDLRPGDIVELSKLVDQVVMLDQDQDTYTHYKIFITTFRLMYDLESQGINTEYRDNIANKNILYFHTLLRENRSFCGYPFTLKLEHLGNATVCPKSITPITKIADVKNWQTDPEYTKIRNKMIAGKKVAEHCDDCYQRENKGVESSRMFETLEWAVRLKFESIEDFKTLENPVFYEVRPSNKCNIMCRMCDAPWSHLIEKEFKTIGIPVNPMRFEQLPFDAIDLPTAKRIYVAGGEPTIMPEVYNFAQKCIDTGHTDFEFNFGTNGMKFSNKLMDLLDHFSNVTMSVSFDGYRQVNDYIRWKSDFDTIVKNCRMAIDRGHTVAFQTVPSIYNVSRLHEIFEFYDREFPNSGLLLQVSIDSGFLSENKIDQITSAYNRPDAQVCLDSLIRCTKTKIYYMNGRSLKTIIDSLITYYSSDPVCNTLRLKKFFKFNDMLDQSRNSRLGDYIPELEACRSFIS